MRSKKARYPSDAPVAYRWSLVAAICLLAGVLVWRSMQLSGQGLHDPDARPRAVTPRGELTADEKATIELFRQASPSVVYITSVEQRSRFSLNAVDIRRGTGSGFIWDTDGHIITNYHVLAQPERQGERGANVWRVTLADGTSYRGEKVGTSREKDLAVLKIRAPASKLDPLEIGRSSNLQVGQKVLAIGNPFGLDQTLTTGIISAMNREIRSAAGVPITGVIQTDAAINPGNSGGPLLDSSGRLIGVNTAIYSPSGAYAGIGFAVPVDIVNEIVPQLIRSGTFVRPGLGIQIYQAWDLTLKRDGVFSKGVHVVGFSPRSNARAAGLIAAKLDGERLREIGDIIIGIDDHEIRDQDDLFKVLGKYKAGDVVRVKVRRRNREHTIRVKLQNVEGS